MTPPAALPPGRAASLALGAALFAAIGLLWWRFHPGPPAAPPYATVSDLVQYYAPMTELAAARLARGELPLWNPRACSGVPLFATLQVGALYPPTWLAVALPAHRALALRALFECLLAGVSAAALFRVWGRSRPAALAGGVLFVFACALGQSFWPPLLSAIAWWPWILLCVEKLAGGGERPWGLGLTAGFALQLLAGFPQAVAYGLFLAVPLAVMRLWEERRVGARALARRGARLVAALALGAGVAAVQLLPALELAAESERGEELAPADVHYLNPWPVRSAQVLANAVDPSAKNVGLASRGAGYLGLVTPVWIALGVAAGWRRPRTWLFVAVGAGALWLSDGYLGAWSAPYELCARLPLVGGFRTPERLRLLTLFCAIALAVAGFDRLLLARGAERVRLRVVALAAGFALLAALAAAGSAGAAWRVAVGVGLLLAGLAGSAPAVVARAGALGLLVLLVADLVAATEPLGLLRAFPVRATTQFRVAGGGRLPMELVAAERDAVGLGRIALPGALPRLGSGPAGELYRPSCYGPLLPRAWVDLDRRIAGPLAARRGARGRSVGVLADLDPETQATLLDVASVQRILRLRPDGAPESLVNADALPRAYLSTQHRIATPDEALAHVLAGDLDFRETVLVERDPGLAPPARPEPLREARITAYEPERVAVEADAPRAALLVLTDTYFPGWEAEVDGAPAEILRANGLFRAVALPPGRHRVEFHYRPRSLRRGAALSIASLVLLLAALRHPAREPIQR